jgi:hypothetical protein
MRARFFYHTFFFSLSLFRSPGVSNVMNVPVSPVLAALVLTAAILFAVVCIVLATIYRKHSHKYVSFSFLANFNFHNFSCHSSSSSKMIKKSHSNHRNSAEKLKNAKTMDMNGKSDCQLQSMSQVTTRGENGSLSTPLVVDGNLMRQSPQLMMMGNGADAIDGDDTDPDVIPNQYGENYFIF